LYIHRTGVSGFIVFEAVVGQGTEVWYIVMAMFMILFFVVAGFAFRDVYKAFHGRWK
jgi:hypothetical protein